MTHAPKWVGVLAGLMLLTTPAAADGPPTTYRSGPYMHETVGIWNGIYIAASIGYAYSLSNVTHDWTDVGPVNVTDRYGINQDGLFATGTVGFDRHMRGDIVWGFFADYTHGDIRDRVSLATPGNADLRFKLQDSWAAGGRLGIVHQATLVYLAAGYTGIDVSLGGLSGMMHGYFVAAGLEKDIHPNFRLTFEYRFSDYGKDTLFEGGAERIEVDSSLHSVRLGLAYAFGHHERPHHEPLK